VPRHERHNQLNILYITYDGLLDPLGGSQILPYIYGISSKGKSIHILSFEKKTKSKKELAFLKKKLNTQNISWSYLSFTSKLGIIGKVFDLIRIYLYSFWLVLQKKINVIHARGHTTAEAGILLKRIFKVNLIFDFRGFWVDERVDKGGWDMKNLLHRLQYRYYKDKERILLKGCDKLVVLTEAVIPEVIRLGSISRKKITVIPCCADYNHFKLAKNLQRNKTRSSLGLPANAIVLGYLGSIGKMYRPDLFIKFIEMAIKGNKSIYGLVITQDKARFNALANKIYPKSISNRIIVVSGNRDEMPDLIASMSILIAFYNITYAKVSMSPTKIAEAFAVGIPVICNSGVGDTDELVKRVKGGFIIREINQRTLSETLNKLESINKQGGKRLREESRIFFGLEHALKLYNKVYNEIGLKVSIK
jgi:glycosyltransferase involved in cell wall biosynthesis|tara:strand:- start:766 stop:2025 length:1260 start_codon:yes stop_codon:yes gene_type:complete